MCRGVGHGGRLCIVKEEVSRETMLCRGVGLGGNFAASRRCGARAAVVDGSAGGHRPFDFPPSSAARYSSVPTRPANELSTPNSHAEMRADEYSVI